MLLYTISGSPLHPTRRFAPRSPPNKFAELVGLKALYDNFADTFAKPHIDVLLPDWPMPNVPPNVPCPHTLVLDLEETLVNASWDKKYGWRYAKRPGVDKFLSTMANYYEIVLMSPSLAQNAEPVVASLDKERTIMHHIFREGLHYIDGVHVKDISKLNRPLNRIIVLDDQYEAVKLHPENLIKVKPYTDKHDRQDKTLENLIPILVEIAKSNTKDVPKVLSQFRGMDADQISEAYNERIMRMRSDAVVRGSRGLGAYANRSLPAPEMAPRMESEASKKGLTSKDLMGDVSGADKIESRKGGAVGWFEQRQRDKEELQQVKMQKWQQIMMEREKKRQDNNA